MRWAADAWRTLKPAAKVAKQIAQVSAERHEQAVCPRKDRRDQPKLEISQFEVALDLRHDKPVDLAIGAVEYVERSRSTLLCRPAEERLGIWKPRKDFSDLIAQFVRIGLWRERIKLRKYLALHTAHVAAQCCIHQRRYFERSLFHQKPCAALPF